MSAEHILTLSGPDRPGIVAAITDALHRHGGNIIEASQFEDAETGRFFMRVVFTLDGSARSALTALLTERMDAFALTWRMRLRAYRPKVLLLASRFDHCLVDLLYRQRIGELAMDVIGIVSNHPRTTYDELGDTSFHYLPITKETKAAQEAQIKSIVEAESVDLVILARYMQILSDDLAAHLAGRCINIHHSFLPGFKGARPYHQAHARGVKMIGATAHYVTANLDEGPIIAQDVEPVTHADSPESLVRKGRDIERRVLARAVGAHLEDRVLINGAKTVVF